MSADVLAQVRVIHKSITVSIVAAFVILLSACGEATPAFSPTPGQASAPTGEAEPDAAGPTPVLAQTSTPASTQVKITPGPSPSPTATVDPTETPVPTGRPVPLTLELLSPQDGAGVETGALRVFGKTRVDAVVGINGAPVARIPHLAQTSDAVNRQLSCFSSRYMNLLAVFQI